MGRLSLFWMFGRRNQMSDVSTAAATETLQALAQQQANKLPTLVKNQFLGHIPGSI
jgi:hypothetical protein